MLNSKKKKRRIWLIQLLVWAGRIANPKKRKKTQQNIIQKIHPPKTD